MPVWLSTLLEIIKVTVPALIVFLTVYYLLKQYTETQLRLKNAEVAESRQGKTLPLRLQAYERLSLLCERISIPNLVLRTPKDGLTASEFKVALMIAIQQEFEHNITQQVYVSEQLWEILKISRDDAVNFIGLVAEKVPAKSPARELAEALLQYHSSRETSGIDKALLAIKKEAGVLLS
ncbi:MAG: hypothetical protein H6562_19860 [Lewinellaceae bacterium]|nr:hypothetical protein [Lewinella sp.]MCB9281154.1 hypothetical protein [Lewinellaceae bacterium]